jgi:hypothetical protein
VAQQRRDEKEQGERKRKEKGAPRLLLCSSNISKTKKKKQKTKYKIKTIPNNKKEKTTPASLFAISLVLIHSLRTYSIFLYLKLFI